MTNRPGMSAPEVDHDVIVAQDIIGDGTWQARCVCGYRGRKAVSMAAASRPALTHVKAMGQSVAGFIPADDWLADREPR